MSQNVIVLVGRILLSIIFIVAGYGKLMGFAGTVGYIGSLGLPVPAVTTALVIALELLGGIAILIGFQTRYVAYALAAFCVASGYLGHFPADMIGFQKNIAMAGGFLVLAAFGPGSLSVDARRA